MKTFLAGLKDKPDLLAAVARFNAPEPGAFGEALPAAPPGETLRKLEGSRAGRAMVRAWVFRQLGVKGFFTDFREERRRLAFLGREALTGLALAYGASLYAPDIARLVKRAEVAALRELLGPHYEYAISRGRFETRRAGERFASFKAGAPWPERLAEAGFAALRLCLADWPEDLRRLAAPRLPEALRIPADQKNTDMLPVLWADLKKLLLTRVDPRWKTCFA